MRPSYKSALQWLKQYCEEGNQINRFIIEQLEDDFGLNLKSSIISEGKVPWRSYYFKDCEDLILKKGFSPIEVKQVFRDKGINIPLTVMMNLKKLKTNAEI